MAKFSGSVVTIHHFFRYCLIVIFVAHRMERDTGKARSYERRWAFRVWTLAKEKDMVSDTPGLYTTLTCH